MRHTQILMTTRDARRAAHRAARTLALANSETNHARFFEYQYHHTSMMLVNISPLTITARLSWARTAVALGTRADCLCVLYRFLGFILSCRLDFILRATFVSDLHVSYCRRYFYGPRHGGRTTLSGASSSTLAAGPRHCRDETVPAVGNSSGVFIFIATFILQLTI